MVAAVIALSIASFALFSAAESALLAANPLRLEISTPRRNVTGRVLRRMLARTGRLLLTCQAGRVTSTIVLSAVLAVWVVPPTTRVIVDLGAHFWVSTTLAIGALLLLATVVLAALGDLLPRSAAAHRPERTLRLLAVPLRILQIILAPIIRLAHLVTTREAARNGRFSLLDEVFAREFERLSRRIRPAMAEVDAARGEFLFENVLAMANTRVKDSMVPRTDIVGIEDGRSIDDARRIFVDSGYSKLPVYRDNLDTIVGVVFAHDLFAGPDQLADIVRPARFVPESKPSKQLLREFLARNTSIAIVIDEYGGTAGLVTREDLLEELFGDIQDEFDSEDDVLERTEDGTVLASGRVDLERLAGRAGVNLPEGEYESLAGFLLERIGTIPRTGTTWRFDGHTFAIVKATPSRIELVRISTDHPSGHRLQA